ncbi:amidohydrolase family protein [Brevibacillus humidisoli]|uniref:amidohydrolase family protein n=1 Tax=Brevibacillus humidisoli TaxID=2895522 RepID=UPI001E55CD92|nr:amidohydrolase family protein [Brevibacillus humidisoli]UFJ42474.1 amidohydrolase family protein [Brevibacillus humidisoli]
MHVGRLRQEYTVEFADEMMRACGKQAEELTVEPESLLAEMDRAGVERAVLLAFNARRTLGVHVTNELVGKWCSQVPQRFLGLASYDGRDSLRKRELVLDRKRYRLSGYKLAYGYLAMAPDEPDWWPLYEDALEHDLPVLVHMGFSPIKRVSLRHCHPGLLEPVLSRYPSLKLVIAHMGWPWISETIELMARYPNTYADLSIVSRYQPIEQVVEIFSKAAAAGVEGKLLFGTDYPMCGFAEGLARIKELRQRVRVSTGGISEGVWDKILYGNAKHLLNLP